MTRGRIIVSDCSFSVERATLVEQADWSPARVVAGYEQVVEFVRVRLKNLCPAAKHLRIHLRIQNHGLGGNGQTQLFG